LSITSWKFLYRIAEEVGWVLELNGDFDMATEAEWWWWLAERDGVLILA
jgi:hypothetical protein